jgi:hypothetical protein
MKPVHAAGQRPRIILQLGQFRASNSALRSHSRVPTKWTCDLTVSVREIWRSLDGADYPVGDQNLRPMALDQGQ